MNEKQLKLNKINVVDIFFNYRNTSKSPTLINVLDVVVINETNWTKKYWGRIRSIKFFSDNRMFENKLNKKLLCFLLTYSSKQKPVNCICCRYTTYIWYLILYALHAGKVHFVILFIEFIRQWSFTDRKFSNVILFLHYT